MRNPIVIVEIRVGKAEANIVGAILSIVLCVLAIVGVQGLPHYRMAGPWDLVLFLGGMVILFPFHEGLHAVGLLRFAGVKWSEIRFGIFWKALMPYCHCTVPIRVGAYRSMALLPLWVTGACSLAVVMLAPTEASGALFGICVSACVGDVWMVLRLRSIAPELWVQDNPTEIGCDVLAENGEVRW